MNLWIQKVVLAQIRDHPLLSPKRLLPLPHPRLLVVSLLRLADTKQHDKEWAIGIK